MKKTRVRVIGGGLAGVEAAYHLAQNNIPVDLYEMRPHTHTPAHETGLLGELVCSNSLKGQDPATAHGMLKKEITCMNSLVLETARATQVPAGKALCVDRQAFAQSLTEIISAHKGITVKHEEVSEIDIEIPTIIATGPLTSEAMSNALAGITLSRGLFFYDALSPIIDADSIDMDATFFGARWEDNSQDYLNCPMDKGIYYDFIDALVAADKVQARAFEKPRFFDACLPVEIIASRGQDSLRFGPMRPVGIIDPKDKKRPFAVVQLRKENLKGSAYNLVGFQTRLKYKDQKRVFGMIPGLKNVVFLRHGSIHRNTFIDSPRLLDKDLGIKGTKRIFVAGQLTGVEGYVESAATGIIAAYAMQCFLEEKTFTPPGADTAIGALIHYITDPEIKTFQPMNINFGIIETPQCPKKIRRQTQLANEETAFQAWLKTQT
ncbi:MAG: methylenetetrahydrofolate--tRNA-(uracil(54)-C(5))-methyltransferase (FADH(2)-oxidizing) TrmFO [Thermodesulfobacteriota bacterium]|nr:methylenetetrahydrofolate--tRNA-(uracil(54)-C(5))-methyltransferase (FADH(2)-oxidizing) TrmFO [Thermodesulfobacteriota bacterium]